LINAYLGVDLTALCNLEIINSKTSSEAQAEASEETKLILLYLNHSSRTFPLSASIIKSLSSYCSDKICKRHGHDRRATDKGHHSIQLN